MKPKRKKVGAKDDEAKGRINQLTEVDCIKSAMLTSKGDGPDIDCMEGAVDGVLIDGEGSKADQEGIAMDGGAEKKEEE